MTSRERITACIRGEPTDHAPLCFEGICHGILPMIDAEYPDPFDRAEYFLQQEIDTAISINPPPFSRLGFQSRSWIEHPPSSEYPVFHRRYETSGGALEQIVRKTEDYPDRVRVFSDHNVPKPRSIRYLVSEESELPALRRILRPPSDGELTETRRFARDAREACDEKQVLMAGTLNGVGDPLLWMSGVEQVLYSAVDDPQFLDQYIEIVAALDDARLDLLIDLGVDLVVRRGWYESTDFWSPELFRRFLYRPLRRQVERAHEAGVTFVYVMNSGYAPLLEDLATAGIDMLSNVDETTGRVSLPDLAQRVDGAFAMCGGVNNFETIERGSAEDVERAVEHALGSLSPTKRFVLAPGDSILSTSESARRNYRVMLDAWRRLR